MKDHPHQCIHCNVSSCKHLDQSRHLCCLEAITVTPSPAAHNGNAADESMCRDYQCK